MEHNHGSDIETQIPDDYDLHSDESQNNSFDDVEIRDVQGNVRRIQGYMRTRDIWNLSQGEKIIVYFNNQGQPIKQGGGILGSWLESIARKNQFCSIEYESWRKVPKEDKEAIIELIKKYFELPDNVNVQRWVLASISRKWKNYKCELKCKHCIPEKTEEQVASLVPDGVNTEQWKNLVHFWFSKESQERAQNIINDRVSSCESSNIEAIENKAKEIYILEAELQELQADYEVKISKMKEEYGREINDLKNQLNSFQAEFDHFRQFFNQRSNFNSDSQGK